MDDDKGPDYDAETKTGGGGLVWGGLLEHGQHWQRAGSYWVLMSGQKPQDLLRLTAHPRVKNRRWVDGAHEGQRWSIPVLLRHLGPKSHRSNVDGVWNGEEWDAGDLTPLVAQLVTFANEVPMGADDAAIDRAFLDLAVALMAVDHWIDLPLLGLNRWLSQATMERVVFAAAGLDVGTEMA